jgi:hypothetical protein
MRRIIVFVAALVLNTASANAEFVANYSEWRDMSQPEKSVYARGMVDGMTIFGGSKDQLAFGNGLIKCLSELKITDVMLSEGITHYYQQNTSQWDKAPALAFMDVFTNSLCRERINAARVALGLSPWGQE